jgi:hypothetical protein
VIVTSHQPTYLPGVSVMAKIAAADFVVWLDQVQFTMPGWLNQNRLPDGTWLRVPVNRPSHRSTVSEATIAEDGWQEDHARILRYRYGAYTFFPADLVHCIENVPQKGDRLAGVNRVIAEQLLAHGGVEVASGWQHEYPAADSSLSEKIAGMVKMIGGDTYLATPQEADRLNPVAFDAAGVQLRTFNFHGPNPCSVDPLFRFGQLRADEQVEVA